MAYDPRNEDQEQITDDPVVDKGADEEEEFEDIDEMDDESEQEQGDDPEES